MKIEPPSKKLERKSNDWETDCSFVQGLKIQSFVRNWGNPIQMQEPKVQSAFRLASESGKNYIMIIIKQELPKILVKAQGA